MVDDYVDDVPLTNSKHKGTSGGMGDTGKNEITQLFGDMSEFTGSSREKLLSAVQD